MLSAIWGFVLGIVTSLIANLTCERTSACLARINRNIGTGIPYLQVWGGGASHSQMTLSHKILPDRCSRCTFDGTNCPMRLPLAS